MNICCLLPISMPREIYGPYYDLLMKDYILFKDDATNICIRDVPTGLTDPELIAYYGFRTLNDAEIVRAMVMAGYEHFDAIAGACYFDGGVKIASNILSIPVVGAAESAMCLARRIGNKFAVITAEPAWVIEMEAHIQQLEFSGHAISCRPVRSLSVSMKDLFEGMLKDEPEPLIEDFTAVATGCIEDGADTLIVGCGLVSPVLTVHGVREISGAPIIDPMIASLKTAEMMAKLSKAGMPIKSTRGIYPIPTEELREKGLRNLNMAP